MKIKNFTSLTQTGSRFYGVISNVIILQKFDWFNKLLYNWYIRITTSNLMPGGNASIYDESCIGVSYNLISGFCYRHCQITSDHWASVQTEDIVLRTWEVESSHNYENNQHQTQVFTCPGATKFVVDFDPRCETERRYVTLVQYD